MYVRQRKHCKQIEERRKMNYRDGKYLILSPKYGLKNPNGSVSKEIQQHLPENSSLGYNFRHCVDILDTLSSKFGYKVLYWYPVNSEDEPSWVLKWTPSSVAMKHLVVVSLSSWGRTCSALLEGDVPPELKDVFKEAPDGVETETKHNPCTLMDILSKFGYDEVSEIQASDEETWWTMAKQL